MPNEKAPRGEHGAAGKTNAGGSISTLHDNTPTPRIATGNLRACLTALIAKAEARAEVESSPDRRRKLARLLRALTHRLAACIMAEGRR